MVAVDFNYNNIFELFSDTFIHFEGKNWKILPQDIFFLIYMEV